MQKAFSFTYEDQLGIPHAVCGACTLLYNFREEIKGVSCAEVMVDGNSYRPSKAMLEEIESLVITGCPAYKPPVMRPASNAAEVPFTALIGEASEMEGALVTVFEEVEL